MRLTPVRVVLSVGFSAVISVVLFFGTSGILGPYGQPNDLYHLAILFLLLVLVVSFLVSQMPLGRKKGIAGIKVTMLGVVFGLPLIAFGLWDLNYYLFNYPIPSSVFWSYTLPIALVYYFVVGALHILGIIRTKVRLKK